MTLTLDSARGGPDVHISQMSIKQRLVVAFGMVLLSTIFGLALLGWSVSRLFDGTREIKELINTSVEKVQSGSRLVQDAGTTMREIVESVQRVTDIIGEITAAAGEQSDGIAQVNTAVNQLDQMTQQNATLVEQSAAAAESLSMESRRLLEVLTQFNTGESAQLQLSS